MLITYYRIVGGDEEYIGSTERTAERRYIEHVSCYNTKHGLCASFMLFEKYGVENCHIEEIETRECATKEERYKREGELTLACPKCVNLHVAGRTRDDWYEEARPELLEKMKQNYQDNLGERRAYAREHSKTYYKANAEKKAAYQRANLQRILERRRIARLTPTDL